MSNWFEQHPARSIIVHTLLVSAATWATWATFEFIFDKNKINLYEARIGKTIAEAKEVEARNSVLLTRVEYLTLDNQKLTEWLESTPSTIPYYENKIKLLEEKLKAATLDVRADQKEQPNEYSTPFYHINSQKLDASTAFHDKLTNIVFGAPEIRYGDKADIVLTLPDGKKIKEKDVTAGETWRFNKDGKEYMIMMESIDWATQSFKTSITEIGSNAENQPTP